MSWLMGLTMNKLLPQMNEVDDPSTLNVGKHFLALCACVA